MRGRKSWSKRILDLLVSENLCSLGAVSLAYKVINCLLKSAIFSSSIFIDFRKAFDSVDRDKLWTIMSSKGIPTHLTTTIQKIYKENTIRVNVGNGISEDSRYITQGVKQGCPLSPVLFNLYLDEVIRIWFQKLKLSISKS